MLRSLVLSAVLSLPLASASGAQTALSAQAFEDYVTGRTLYFNLQGTPYGVERYLPDRQVQWSFLDGECKDGRWYEQGGNICFEYEDGTGPQCWTFYRSPEGLRARFEGGAPENDLYEVQERDEPMVCLGPKTGV